MSSQIGLKEVSFLLRSRNLLALINCFICDRHFFYGSAVMHLLRMMSDPREESSAPNMNNSRHILILHGMM